MALEAWRKIGRNIRHPFVALQNSRSGAVRGMANNASEIIRAVADDQLEETHNQVRNWDLSRNAKSELGGGGRENKTSAEKILAVIDFEGLRLLFDNSATNTSKDSSLINRIGVANLSRLIRELDTFYLSLQHGLDPGDPKAFPFINIVGLGLVQKLEELKFKYLDMRFDKDGNGIVRNPEVKKELHLANNIINAQSLFDLITFFQISKSFKDKDDEKKEIINDFFEASGGVDPIIKALTELNDTGDESKLKQMPERNGLRKKVEELAKLKIEEFKKERKADYERNRLVGIQAIVTAPLVPANIYESAMKNVLVEEAEAIKDGIIDGQKSLFSDLIANIKKLPSPIPIPLPPGEVTDTINAINKKILDFIKDTDNARLAIWSLQTDDFYLLDKYFKEPTDLNKALKDRLEQLKASGSRPEKGKMVRVPSIETPSVIENPPPKPGRLKSKIYSDDGGKTMYTDFSQITDPSLPPDKQLITYGVGNTHTQARQDAIFRFLSKRPFTKLETVRDLTR